MSAAAGIASNDCVLGLSDSGAMRTERVKGYVTRLPEGTSELYVHAATSHWPGSDAWPSHYACAGEFAALTDSGVAAALAAQGVVPTSFAGILRAAA